MRPLSRPSLYYLKHPYAFILRPGMSQFAIGNSTFTIRPRTLDGYIINEIYNNHDYKPYQLTPKLHGGVFVDLGGQIGIFSVWAAKEYEPRRIIIVEPEPGNRALLKQNLRQNNIVASVEKRALWHDGEGVFLKYDHRNSGGHRTIDTGEVNTPTLTFAKLLQGVDTVDYLKVDIEGAETVLLSAENLRLIKQKVRYLKMEVHLRYGVSLAEVINKLQSIGFRVVTIPQPFPKRYQTALIEASPTTTSATRKTSARKTASRA